MDEDAVRQVLRELLQPLNPSGTTMRDLSLKIGRSHSYIEQYLSRRKPKKLHYDDKLKIRSILGVPLAKLGITLPADAAPSPAATALNIASDAEPYKAPKDRPYGALASHPNTALYRAKTLALDRHRLCIGIGDLLIVRLPNGKPVELKPDEAYLINLYDRHDPLTATTIIRQHVAPRLLITNSTQLHHILSVDQTDLPFEIIVEGKIDMVIRNSQQS